MFDVRCSMFYVLCFVLVSRESKHSKTPSGRDPNFLERILVPVNIPIKSIFMPQLTIKVIDKRKGGFDKPLVGACSISLEDKVTQSPDFPVFLSWNGKREIKRVPRAAK